VGSAQAADAGRSSVELAGRAPSTLLRVQLSVHNPVNPRHAWVSDGSMIR
jgi:hypothetical protein